MDSTDAKPNDDSLTAGHQLPGSGPRALAPNRLMELLRPTIHHDLPNMLVALQGLLQMLRQEEAGRLSPAGQEYLQRLSAIAQKLQGTVSALRHISKADNSTTPSERIALAELLREVVAACKQLLPRSHLVVHASLAITEVCAPPPSLQQALLEAVRLLASQAGGGEWHCAVTARPRPEGVEITLGTWTAPSDETVKAGTPPLSEAGAIDYNFFGPEQRLNLVLVAELARNWGGHLTTWEVPGQGKCLRMTVPGHQR
jgi:hypothetical protein